MREKGKGSCMPVEVTGFDRFDDLLHDFERDLENSGGEVPVEELIPPEFMRSYSDFDSFGEFLAHSRWDVTDTDDFEAIPGEEFDDYVDDHTKFDDWETMLTVAAREYLMSRMLMEKEDRTDIPRSKTPSVLVRCACST